MAQISITVSETAHWHAMIGRAEYLAHRLLPHGIEDYLVRLFMRFEREGTTVQSKKTEIAEVNEKLQGLGDQCLLLCGFYPEASQEYGIAMKEFVSMGIEAYRKIASSVTAEETSTFEYLAENFEQVSELLCYINEFSGHSEQKKQGLHGEGHEDLLDTFPLSEQPLTNCSISPRVLN